MTSDIEIVRKCAERMGYEDRSKEDDFIKGIFVFDGNRQFNYSPLTDDTQNAALDDVILKHGVYSMHPKCFYFTSRNGPIENDFEYEADMTLAENRRRARCLCVAGLAK